MVLGHREQPRAEPETAARADCQRKTETESVMRLEADPLRYLRERQAESGD